MRSLRPKDNLTALYTSYLSATAWQRALFLTRTHRWPRRRTRPRHPPGAAAKSSISSRRRCSATPLYNTSGDASQMEVTLHSPFPRFPAPVCACFGSMMRSPFLCLSVIYLGVQAGTLGLSCSICADREVHATFRARWGEGVHWAGAIMHSRTGRMRHGRISVNAAPQGPYRALRVFLAQPAPQPRIRCGLMYFVAGRQCESHLAD